MTKRIFVIFIFSLFILGINKVQATSENKEISVVTANLEHLIINKNTNEYLKSVKYNTTEGEVVFEIGDKLGIDTKINTGNIYENAKVMQIIKNGYYANNIKGLDSTSANDLYMATKIAIDCAMLRGTENTVDDYYKIGEDLDQNLKPRAENIINTAKSLLKVEPKIEKPINIVKVGDYDEDDTRQGYYSQTFEVKTNGATITGYRKIVQSITSVNYYLADLAGEPGIGLESNENKFKFMVRDEEYDTTFLAVVEFEFTYDTNKLFKGKNGDKEYIVYGMASETTMDSITFSNKLSTLAVNFIDKDTKEFIPGGTIAIDGRKYKLDEENKIIINELGVSNIKLNVLSIPDNYKLENMEYIVDVQFKEDHIENIELTHKKGNLKIETNVEKATYEVYDEHGNRVYIYDTNEDGSINTRINTGKFLLKQTKVSTRI